MSAPERALTALLRSTLASWPALRLARVDQLTFSQSTGTVCQWFRAGPHVSLRCARARAALRAPARVVTRELCPYFAN